MSKQAPSKIPKVFSQRRILLVVLFCALVSCFLFYREFSKSTFDWRTILPTKNSVLFLLLALLMMVFRDLAYMIRIRLLTNKLLNWKQSIRVILLWEFASTLTPGVVGGSAIAMFIMQREKIPLGKSTALVIVTAVMDNLFYVVFLPMLFIFIPLSTLFPSQLDSVQENGFMLFWIGFSLLLGINLLLMSSLFIFPTLIGNLLRLICKISFLKRYADKAKKVGNDIEISAAELRGKSFPFWIKLFFVTVWSWLSRYLVINFILMAFTEIGFIDNLTILARQLVMWQVMLVTPTPGASGAAEYLFTQLLSDFIQNGTLLLSLAFLWRLVSYYPYLIIGTFLLPRWLKKTSAA